MGLHILAFISSQKFRICNGWRMRGAVYLESWHIVGTWSRWHEPKLMVSQKRHVVLRSSRIKSIWVKIMLGSLKFFHAASDVNVLWRGAVLRCWRFFNAVMRWINPQLAVLRWSQTTRCAMFVFFTLQWSVKWNCLRCWSFFIYLSRT